MAFPDLSPISPLAVYFHIPFCAAKCDYCDFYSEAVTDERVVETVLARMATEFRELYTLLGAPAVSSVYLGGGTPSWVGPHALARLLDRVLTAIGHTVGEVTVEINPRDLRLELLHALSPANRLSIGVQSFDPRTRSLLGRRGSGIDRDGERLLDRWSGRLSLDLIQCIPGQTEASARGDLGRAVDLPLDHLSVYSLSITPGTPLAGRLVALSGEDDKWARMTEKTVSFLADMGFERYEVSNYARPDCESIHNSAYWAGRPYLGVGPGAVSTLVDSEAQPVRIAVESSLASYVEHGRDACEVERPSPADLVLERFMLGLRTKRGVALDGADVRFLRHPRMARRFTGGELVVEDGRLVASKRGLLCLDAVLVDLALVLDGRPREGAHVARIVEGTAGASKS